MKNFMPQKTLIVGLITSTLLLSAPSYAFFDFFKSKATESVEQVQSSAGLISSLTNQLGVSTAQAAGGAGALLAMAGSQLSGSQGSELSGLMSSLGGASDTISSMSGVESAFSALGLDTGMISQFTPIIMDYLGNQGASSGLLSSLGSLWV